jgi:imidazoleglycerol phosphate dehydratase HisB
MRTATIQRDTKETRISGKLKIEGRGRYDISTGIRFFDHMLELFTKHGGFDLSLKADGDLDVDQHHTWKTWASCSASCSPKRWRSQRHQPRRLLRPAHG